MVISQSISREDIQGQFSKLQQKSCYSEIARLLSFSLKNISSEDNRQIFGYIPSLFREISFEYVQGQFYLPQIPVGEPIICKINFPLDKTIRGIPYFYLFCYIKDNPQNLNVYFQSAAKIHKLLSQRQYNIDQKKIIFEGIISAFIEQDSVICISDPGHFIPGLISSFYVGSQQINFARLISQIVEAICNQVGIDLNNIFLFGSSAGAMGALLSGTYFSRKVQVLAVNSQIITYDRKKVMQTLLGTSDPRVLLKKFANRVSCLNRFQQKIRSIPNIYLLANVNDNLHQRNIKFYQLYQQLFTAQGRANQSVFDSYYGVEGHGRPNKTALKRKIEIAKETLSMKSNLINQEIRIDNLKSRKNSNIQLNLALSSSEFSSSIQKKSTNSLQQVNCPNLPGRIVKRNIRCNFIKTTVNTSEAEILEIGAFDNPTFFKNTSNVFYSDYFSKDELTLNHTKTKPQRVENAVDIDYIVKDSCFVKHIDRKFDLIVANHVIEHIPNMIGWLDNLSRILKPDGYIFLTVPHKEYTFDKLRSTTTLRELIRNYCENITAPTIYHLADHLYYHRPIKAKDVWNNNYQHLLHNQRFINIEAAFKEAKKRIGQNGYVDAHCNVFTYKSFLDVFDEIEKAKYTPLYLHSSQEVIEPHNEFYVLLSAK